MHVLFIGPFAQKTSYAQAFHDYALALHRAGVSIQIVPITDCDTDDLDARYNELIDLVRNDRTPTHAVIHTVPAYAAHFAERLPKDIHKTVLTTWETTEMDPAIVEKLKESFDSIIVPSVFCAVSIKGAHAAVVPHCFDVSHWPYRSRRPAKEFVFYSILGWSERKNPIGLLKAYYSEFSSSDNVVLRLKTTGYSNEDIEAVKNATGLDPSQLPKVEMVTGHLSHNEIVEFHHDGDCFVTAARGEGWNLPAFEAAIVGNPVISPNFGGQLDYLTSYQNHFPISIQLTPAICPPQTRIVNLAGVNVRQVLSNQPTGITAKQYWAEPNLYELANHMRFCYEKRVTKTTFSKQKLEKEYGYDVIGEQLAFVLQNH